LAERDIVGGLKKGSPMLKSALLGLAIAISATSANAASFECDKASAMDELTICNDRELSELDVRMAVWFEAITGLVPMGTRGAIQDEQLEWLKSRAACSSDRKCLRTEYLSRIEALKKHYEAIKSRGPF
jgi:uncharacterized protein